MTASEKAYCAGVMDGVLHYKRRRDGRLHIYMHHRNREVLEALQSHLGGTIIKATESSWRWSLYRRTEIEAALLAVEPFIRGQRREVLAVLEVL